MSLVKQLNRDTGALTEVAGSPFSSGPGYSLANDGEPTATEPTPGSVSAFTIDPATGALTPVAGNPLPIAAAGPLSTDNTGKFLFVPEAAGVSVYTINSTSGMLSAVTGSPFSAGARPVLIRAHLKDDQIFQLPYDDLVLYGFDGGFEVD